MMLGRDGYIYFWNPSKNKYIKACDVEPDDLPHDVKKQLRQKREEAKQILELPGV
jgi:hypothetical protein